MTRFIGSDYITDNGAIINSQVIPHAIDFFTGSSILPSPSPQPAFFAHPLIMSASFDTPGKALRQEQSNNYDSQEDDYSDEEESEDDDEDDDDDEDIVVGGKKGRAGAKRAPIAPATPASQQVRPLSVQLSYQL